MMKLVLAVFCALLVVGGAFGMAAYPPGVNAALCPNYPFCDNVLIARHTPTTYTHPGYPANFNPIGCLNYPFCH